MPNIKTENTVPLTKLGKGKSAKITCVDCGSCLKQRLCDLALYSGAVLTVVKNDSGGPMIVKILDSQIVLGRGQAERIMVVPHYNDV